MAFVPTNGPLTDREQWKNSYWNDLGNDIILFLRSLDMGTEFEAPITLTKDRQHLDGGSNYAHSFKRWMGAGSDVSLRDATAFGALGNGSDDDTAAIQAAIDDLPVTGGVVLIPPTDFYYKISTGPLKITGSSRTLADVTLMGFGDSSVIQLEAASDLIEVQDQNRIRLVNLRFEGAGQTGNGITIQDSDNSKLINVTVNNFDGTGVIVDDSDNLLIDGCRISSMSNGSSGWGIETQLTSGNLPEGLIVTNSSILSNTLEGITGAGNGSFRKSCIFNNNISGNGEAAIKLADGAGALSAQISIYRNIISDTVCTGEGAIILTSGSGLTQITIAGNLIEGTTNGSGIYILEAAPGFPTEAVTISGNVIKNNANSGIILRDSVRYFAIFGNVCQNNGTQDAGDDYGMEIPPTTGGTFDNVSYHAICGNACFDDAGANTNSQFKQNGGILLGDGGSGSGSDHCTAVGNSVAIPEGEIFDSGTIRALQNEGTNNETAHNVGEQMPQ